MGVMLPSQLGERYRILGRVGRGGMGQVLRVRDLELDRVVALKLMEPLRTPAQRERFLREARTLARISHPHVLRVFDHGIEEDVPYLVTELVKGPSIHEAPGVGEPLEMLLPIADALDELHGAGILHRDLKPHNVLVGPGPRPVLIDFGLVLESGRTRLTATNMLVGTLMFMEPGLLENRAYEPATDWYGWGATLFYALEARPPYGREELLRLVGLPEIPPPEFRATDPDAPVAHLVRECLATRRDARLGGADAIRRRYRELGGEARGVPTRSHAAVPTTPGPPTTRRRARPPGGAPARRWPRVAAACLGSLVVAGSLATLRGVAPPGGEEVRPPATRVPSNPRRPRVPHAARVAGIRDEFRQFAETAIDPAGQFVHPAPPELPPGWVRLADPDPFRWPDLLSSLPRLRAAMASEGQAEAPEDFLPHAARAAIDELYRSIDLPAPLAPYRPPGSPGSAPPPRELLRYVDDERMPGRLAGWFRVYAESYAAGVKTFGRLDAALNRFAGGEGRSEGLEEWVLPHWSMAPGGLRYVLEAAVLDRDRRSRFCQWTRPGAEHLHRALVAARRHLDGAGAGRDADADLMARGVGQLRAFFLSYLAELPGRFLLGAEPRTPQGRYFLACVLAMRDRSRHDAGLGPHDVLEAATEAALIRGLEELAPDGTAARRRSRAELAGQLIRHADRRGIREEVPGLFVAYEDELYGASRGSLLIAVLDAVVRVWLLRPARHRDRARWRRAIRWIEEVAAEGNLESTEAGQRLAAAAPRLRALLDQR